MCLSVAHICVHFITHTHRDVHLLIPGQEYHHVIMSTKELRKPAHRDTGGGLALKLLLQGKLKIPISIQRALFLVLLMLMFLRLNSPLRFSPCLHSKSFFFSFTFYF